MLVDSKLHIYSASRYYKYSSTYLTTNNQGPRLQAYLYSTRTVVYCMILYSTVQYVLIKQDTTD